MSTSRQARVLASATLLAAAVALTGCSASSAGASDGTTTVTVMYQANEFTEEYVAGFEEENPDLSLEFIEFDENRLNAMITAGEPPDFVRGSPSANLFARGLAEPLDDYIAKSDVITEDDLLPVNDLWKWDGETRGSGTRYGIVKDFSPDTTFWQNTAVFEQAGVAPFSTTEPASWDDVLTTAQALTDAGVTDPIGIEWQWGVAGILQTMVEQQGAHLFSDDLKTADFTSPESVRGIQWLIDYGTQGAGPTSLNPLADGSDAATYLSGRMAASMDGFWFGGNFATDDGAAAGATSSLVPAPTFGERISPVLGGVGAWIPAGSKHKAEAWKVMEYFMAGQPAVDRASSGWGLPSLESLLDEVPTEQPYQQQAFDAAQVESEFVVPLQDSPYMTFTQWNGILDKEVQKGIQGSATAHEVAASVQEQVQPLLDQGVDQLG